MANVTCGPTGSSGQEIVDAINGKVIKNPTDVSWAGTTIADEQALRDFYGDQSITVQGAIVDMKSYPDGSVVGRTGEGLFTMYANGKLEHIIVSATLSTVYTDDKQFHLFNTKNFPISFVDTSYSISFSLEQLLANDYPGGNVGKAGSNFFLALTTTSCVLKHTVDVSNVASSGQFVKVNGLITGAWK